MLLYNTANRSQTVSFETAVFQGLADQSGLFMPSMFPILPKSFFEEISEMTFPEMAYQVCFDLLAEEIGEKAIREICNEAFDFEVPLVPLGHHTYILELFHGPSLAFKDFGARFMARVMSYFNQYAKKSLHILVATSGDTGGAVAMGFYNVPGIQVTILFPKNRVSKYQEVQLTTLGGNIRAIEVDGSFDDCQALVKQAFQDSEISNKLGLTSANSINIARLIPQSLYYFWAWGQLKTDEEPLFSVPSGNFGNICAGAFAKQMGLPVGRLIASVNANRVFTDYLDSGEFIPKNSISTLSNAMDVGNPSNFVRIEALLGDVNGVRDWFSSYSFSDQETQDALLDLWNQFGYASEPHAAVGYLGLEKFRKETGSKKPGIILGTAHPSKFLHVLPQIVQDQVEIPDSLLVLLDRKSEKKEISVDYKQFKTLLLQAD